MEFLSSFASPDSVFETDLFFVIYQNRLLIKQVGDVATVPRYSDLGGMPEIRNVQYIGTLDETHCYAAAASRRDSIVEDAEFCDMRKLFGPLNEALFWTAVRAMHVVNWDLETQFCGACGAQVSWMEEERAKKCPECDRIAYPVICPAIITAIVRDGRLLLLNHVRSPDDFYALLAGFVEPGESLEQAVEREVFEEAGLAVKNIRYFGSQPWGFTQALMVGFTAEYDGGDLKLQASEIRDAGWFEATDLPYRTFLRKKFARCSIAWKLLKWFEETYG